MRLTAVVAAAAAVVNLLLLGLLHVVSPEVDPITRPVSEYALGEFGWLAIARTLVEGVGAIALAVALLLERAVARRVERAAALLLLVVGLLKLAIPLFPVDALGTPATSAGQMHNILGNLTFFLFPLAALLLFRALSEWAADWLPRSQWCWRSRQLVCWSETLSGIRLGPTCLPGFVRALGAHRRSSDTSQPSLSRSSMNVLGPADLILEYPLTQVAPGRELVVRQTSS
jgi:hypothetical protein